METDTGWTKLVETGRVDGNRELGKLDELMETGQNCLMGFEETSWRTLHEDSQTQQLTLKIMRKTADRRLAQVTIGDNILPYPCTIEPAPCLSIASLMIRPDGLLLTA